MPHNPRSSGTANLRGPPSTCDCHLHVFGDPATYPYGTQRCDSPPARPLADYLAGYQAFARRCGI